MHGQRDWLQGARPILAALPACIVILLSALLAGCSSQAKAARRSGYGRVVTPMPPAFLTGPASLLMTNASGFSAHAELKAENSTGSENTSTGQLLVRGSKFLYAPEVDEPNEGARHPGEYSFIWDAAENRGYVLSEALQAYAPFTAALHVTNLQSATSRSPAQHVGGHPCESAAVTAHSADGPISTFEVQRATDLTGLPLRIETVTNSVPFTLTLSKVRIEAPASELFSPPDGFAKYPSPQAMADELAAREHNLRRRSSSSMDELLMPEQHERRY